MTDRHHNYAGITLRFQTKLFVKDGEIDAFDRHRIQTHCRHAEQEVAHVKINLFRHPLIVIFQLFAVHIGKEGAAFVVAGFGFRSGKTAIGVFLINNFFQPRIVHRGFRTEHDNVGSVEDFTFVEHVGAAGRFRDAGFAFIAAGDDKVPRLGVGARRAILQQRFQVFRLFGRQLFRRIKGLSGVTF